MSGRFDRVKTRPATLRAAPGRDDAWSQMSTLIAGPLAWGAIGFGVDEATGFPVFLPVGIVIGFAASMWLVFHRYTLALAHEPGMASEHQPTRTKQ